MSKHLRMLLVFLSLLIFKLESMITLYWHHIVAIAVVLVSIGYCLAVKPIYGYLPDLRKGLAIIGALLFIVIWGGIFWW